MVRANAFVITVALVASAGCRRTPPMDPPGDPRPLGELCAIDSDCVAGLECWQSELIGPAWCTRACSVDDDCPLGARCADVEPDLEGSGWIRRCAPSCVREEGTRGGCPATMRCEGDGVCEPNACAQDAECLSGDCEESSGRCRSGGNPEASAEQACLDDSDCRYPNGTCIDGECYHLDCDLGGAYACLEGEVCHAYFPGSSTTLSRRCRRACTPGVDATSPTSPGVCEAGEVCWPPEADPGPPPPAGYCSSPLGGTFAEGTASARVGDPCTSVADCLNPLGYGWCSSTGCAISNCAVAAFGGVDPCGAGAACVHDDVAPAGWSLEEAAYLRAGFCVRTCSDADPCPPGRTCNAEGVCS